MFLKSTSPEDLRTFNPETPRAPVLTLLRAPMVLAAPSLAIADTRPNFAALATVLATAMPRPSVDSMLPQTVPLVP